MSAGPTALAAMVGSRICHDLISPIGAINNGLELLELGGAETQSPEMALIRDSVEAAAARIKLFRIAFGHSDPAQQIAGRELARIMADVSKGNRVQIAWSAAGDATRGEAQLACLAVMCLEVALPRGGEVTVTQDGSYWEIRGTGPHLQVDSGLWDALAGAPAPELAPSKVQFALLAALSEAQGKSLNVGTTPDALTLDIGPA